MANKKFVVKNGLHTQNIDFVSPNEANTIKIEMLDSDTISFRGESGQLFSVTDNLTGTIFAVNDISGVPSIEVDDTGEIRLAETFGNVLIGTATDNAVDKLQINGSVSSGSLTVNGGTKITATPALNISETWNEAATVFTGIKYNVTNTASATGSLLLDLQANSTSKFKVENDGSVTITGQNATNKQLLTLTNMGAGTGGIKASWASGGWFEIADSATKMSIGVTNHKGLYFGVMGSGDVDGNYIFDADSNALLAGGPLVSVKAANIKKLDITQTGGIHSYNTYTDAANYERMSFGWSANNFYMNAELAGTGAQRDIRIQSTGGKVTVGNTTVIGSSSLSVLVPGINIPAIGLKYGAKEWGIGVEHNTDRFAVKSLAGAAEVVVGTSDNSSTGISFQGAGSRGGIFADSSYNMYIKTNASYGDTTLFFSNDGTGAQRISMGNATPSAKLSVSDVLLAGSGTLANSLVDLAQTWNTTGNPTAIKLNVTNTASGANSLLMDLQVGGSSKFSVNKNGNAALSGNLTVVGDLIVNGTTTSVNSTVISVDDPVFTLGGDVAPTVDDNKDRGIEFRWHNGTTAKTGFFGFDDSTGKFTFIPDATNTSEVFSGVKGTLDASIEWADVLNKPDPIITLAGDLSGSVTLTDLGSGTLTATIAANSVALGIDTTGDYVAALTAGTGISVTGTAGEGWSPTVTNTDPGSAQFIFKNIAVAGQTAVSAETNNDTLTLVAGTNVTITTDAVNDTITINANDTAVDWAEVLNKPDPIITLAGDLTGSVTLTDLGSGTLTATIAANSVALGTDTVGNYVASVGVSGTGLSVSGTGEGAVVTVTSNATDLNTPSTIVARDASGNFKAGSITTTNSRIYGLTRAVPTVVNDAINIGGATLLHGAATFEISVVVADSGFSVSKNYIVPINFNETGPSVWQILAPIADGGAFEGQDYALDVMLDAAGNTVSFRLRRISGAVVGTANITIRQSGATLTFIESSTVAAVAAPTLYYNAAVLTQRDGIAYVKTHQIWHAGNDGNGSGLDADMVDGLHPASANTPSTLVSRDASGNFSAGNITANITGSIQTPNAAQGIFIGDDVRLADRNTANTLYIEGSADATAGYVNFGQAGNSLGATGAGALTWRANTVWHAGNDGAGSTLDADLLDGQQGSYYLDWTNATNKPDPVITVTLTGDVTGTANTTLTDLASGTISVPTVIADNSHNHTTLTGITSLGFATDASDSASIAITLNGSQTFFDFNLTDDNNSDQWRWRFTPSGSTVYDAMRLVSVANGASNLIVAGSVTGTQLISNIASGTAPLVVTSTTAVANLNADMLDGLHSTSFARLDVGNTNIPLEASMGAGIRFWGSDNYKIWMSNTTDATWGGRIAGDTTSDYNMYFRMTGGVNRGFAFLAGVDTATDAAIFSINPDGVRSTVALTAPTINATTFVGSLDWANVANKPDPTITLGGVLSGSVTLTDLASGTLTASVVANSIALGTATTGNYAASVDVSGNGLSITGAAGEGTTFTVNSNATSANTASTVVFRDASGNFSAGTVSATALDVDGTLVDNATVTTTATTQTVLASFPAATYGCGKFLIQATQGTVRHIVELLVTHDGTTAKATAYGTILTGASLFTADVDINTGNVRVLITSASATSTVYKTTFTLIGA